MEPQPQALIALARVAAVFFQSESACAGCRPLPAEQLPQAARGMLAHDRHMTAVLAQATGGLPDLRVIQAKTIEDAYSRRVALLRRHLPIEVAIVRVRLSLLPADCRAELLAAGAPLGEILTRQNIPRSIEPLYFFEFGAESPLATPFGPARHTTYGRVGRIWCEGRAAIEMIEIIDPGAIEKLQQGQPIQPADPAVD